VSIGYINRVHLVREKFNNSSKGVVFVTFKDKKNVQRAIDCLSGFSYDNLILHVEWADK
jgi:RNA recognition motif-containing protein